jgi:peptidoglycan/LPS O-acetylase OafA/YrhL
MEVLQNWVSYFSFSFVLASDFIIDIFFLLSAFLATFLVLKRMKDHEGDPGSYAVYCLHLYMRYTPVYMFNIFFFWKFISMFGDGPTFFRYGDVAKCS